MIHMIKPFDPYDRCDPYDPYGQYDPLAADDRYDPDDPPDMARAIS